MARPRKCRKVCHFPRTQAFLPEERQQDLPAVILTIDEYEAIRLIDKEGLDQEACSRFMQVARTTVQQIYTTARKSWQKPLWKVGPCVSKAATIACAKAKTAAAAAPVSNSKFIKCIINRKEFLL